MTCTRNLQLPSVDCTYIFFCRGDLVIPSSDIINNYLERKVALKYYTTVFPLAGRTLYVKKTIFFSLCTYSVVYKKPSVIFIHRL